MPPDVRDAVVDFVRDWAAKAELPAKRLLGWAGLAAAKYHAWTGRYGKAHGPNGTVPRDHWLTAAEKKAIVDFHHRHPLEGYRRLTYMMIDRDVVACSPATVYRVLSVAGLLKRWNARPNAKGTGFVQPAKPHDHWHVDVSYLNLAGTFYYLCSVLDGASRAVVHWDIRERMTEPDVEQILQKAKECHPGVTPRVISDNGPQFLARDFKEFIRISGMTHVKTSPYYPQSNGKIERFHRTLKHDAVRTQTPLTQADADRVVARFVTHYNTERLHSALGYVTPHDFLAGRQPAIHADRDRKLEAARDRRRDARQADRNAHRKVGIPDPRSDATLPTELRPVPDPLSSSPTPTNSAFR
ncbi:MAG TPA: IS3 family transposase [Fimbriiglobus sp.]